MALTKDEVQHIAALCRIGVTDEELELMSGQLSQVLDMFQTLQGLDTDGVEPTAHSISLDTVLREDQAGESEPVENILSNAPVSENDLIRVKAVLED